MVMTSRSRKRKRESADEEEDEKKGEKERKQTAMVSRNTERERNIVAVRALSRCVSKRQSGQGRREE